MNDLGLVERFGYGIGLIRRLFKENGNPEPEFDVQPHAVLVTLRPRP